MVELVLRRARSSEFFSTPSCDGQHGLTLTSSFGFEDGISQPLIEGLDETGPKGKEPKAVKSG